MRKRLTLTDNDKTRVVEEKCVFGLAEQNGCNEHYKNSKYSKGDTDILGMTVITIEIYTI